jgi:hypothetical protein
MLVFKLISGLVVIKASHVLYVLKRLLAVTFPAILTKLVVVRIFMTAGAVAVLQTCKLLKFFPVGGIYLMTFCAVNRCMFSCKPEFSIVMTEFRSRLEPVGIMACRAILRKSSEMIVSMAGQAFLSDTQVGFFSGFKLRIGNV